MTVSPFPASEILTPVLPFTLAVPGESAVRGFRNARSVQHLIAGLVRLDGPSLRLEWSGITRTDEAGFAFTGSRTTRLPVSRLELPITRLLRIDLRRSWRGAAIEIWLMDLETLAGVPGVEHDCLRLQVARRDRELAADLVATVRLEMADAVLRAGEALALPQVATVGSPEPLHVAVVHGTDQVTLVTVAPSRAGLDDQLAEYASRHAGERLWPEDADRVTRLVEGGQRREAVELYFARVGRRWDEERLVVTTVGRTD